MLGLVIAGYLSAWFGFGIAAHIADLALHEALAGSSWLTFNGWAIGALAGALQFSALKYRCLDKCRATLSFVMEHWRGRQERTQAFRMGWRHGVFCVGCCWALMLLMFAVGTGNRLDANQPCNPDGRAIRHDGGARSKSTKRCPTGG